MGKGARNRAIRKRAVDIKNKPTTPYDAEVKSIARSLRRNKNDNRT